MTASASGQIDVGHFRRTLGHFCTGVTVVAAIAESEPVGFACQSFAALSLEPPLVLFCPTKVSRSWQAIEASGHFCVNVLHEKQKDVSARFGSKVPDKFAGIEWSPSKLGSPIIEATLAHIDCTVHSVLDGGDHYVVFGSVHSLSDVPHKKPRPLLFYRGEYTGIEPDKNTPAQWRDDLEAFLTATTDDTWL
jgi:3-hydroxy-9,10-secoandrosta-1,3,5(10)-triene-9,17-dione monooxygenase reductase component